MVIIREIKHANAAAKVFLFLSKLVIVGIHDVEDRDFGSMSCHIIFASQLNGALKIFLILKSGPSSFLSLTMFVQREQKDTREDAAVHDHESYAQNTVPSESVMKLFTSSNTISYAQIEGVLTSINCSPDREDNKKQLITAAELKLECKSHEDTWQSLPDSHPDSNPVSYNKGANHPLQNHTNGDCGLIVSLDLLPVALVSVLHTPPQVDSPQNQIWNIGCQKHE